MTMNYYNRTRVTIVV